jgi:uncharacterized protein YdcH (DUF465 family)
MNIEEIRQAISKLSPEELAHFRAWFEEYLENAETDKLTDSQEELEERLKRLKGSLKGTGILKALMEDRRKESLL